MAATPDQAEEQGKQVRRRTFLIDSRFQLKWTMIIVSVGVFISLGLGYFILRLSFENTDLLGLDEKVMAEASKFDSQTMIYLIGFVVLMAVALFTWGIFMTHRVAGPIYIISRYLRQIAEGQVPQTRPLRKRDEMVEFFDTFSQMINYLRQHNTEEAELLEMTLKELKEKGVEAPEAFGHIEALIERKRQWGVTDQTK